MLVSSYVNGSTAGSPPPYSAHARAPRGEVKGWTKEAVRRHTKFLYSIEANLLTGRGVAVTLTIRDCPESADVWKRDREALFRQLARFGLVRGHWLTEWQKRKVPHMHCAIYFPDSMTEEQALSLILTQWLRIVRKHSPGTEWAAQDGKGIDGAVGWLQYLSKHAARGVRHYQRWGHPPSWDRTGRLWGKVGVWPEIPPMRFDMPSQAYWRYRRLMRSWRIADARQALIEAKKGHHPERVAAAISRLSHARRMLASTDPKLSPVRGVSEWAGESHTLALIGLLHDEGFLIRQRDE